MYNEDQSKDCSIKEPLLSSQSPRLEEAVLCNSEFSKSFREKQQRIAGLKQVDIASFITKNVNTASQLQKNAQQEPTMKIFGAKQIFQQERLNVQPMLKEAPSKLISNHQNVVYAGDCLGNMSAFDLETKQIKTWRHSKNGVSQVTVFKDLLFVCSTLSDNALVVFNVFNFMNSDRSVPEIIHQYSICYGVDSFAVIPTQEGFEVIAGDWCARTFLLDFADLKTQSNGDNYKKSWSSYKDVKVRFVEYIAAKNIEEHYWITKNCKLVKVQGDEIKVLHNENPLCFAKGLVYYDQWLVVGICLQVQDKSYLHFYDQEDSFTEVDVSFIGEINTVQVTSSKELYISGSLGMAFFNGLEVKQIFQVNSFKVLNGYLTQNQSHLVMIDSEGTCRYTEWHNEIVKPQIPYDCLYQAMSSPNQNYMAISNVERTQITVYSISSYPRPIFQGDISCLHMIFSADSQHLLILTGGSYTMSGFTILTLSCDEATIYQQKTTFDSSCSDLKGLQFSVEHKELFIIHGNFLNPTLEVFTMEGESKFQVNGIYSIATQSMGNLLAMSHSSRKIQLMNINTKDVIGQFSVSGVATYMQFFQDSERLAALFNDSIQIFGILPFQCLYTFKASTNVWSRFEMCNDQILVFEDKRSRLQVLDLHSKQHLCEMKKKIKNHKYGTNYCDDPRSRITPWAIFGNCLFFEVGKNTGRERGEYGDEIAEEEDVGERTLHLVQFPFTSFQITNSVFLNDYYTDNDDFYMPVAGGNSNKYFDTFRNIFENALENGNIEVLQKVIRPYNLNSLHYFALFANVKGIKYAFENNVKFLFDWEGKTPFHYALISNNYEVLQVMFQGMKELPNINSILQQINIDVLIQNSDALSDLLLNCGTSLPILQGIGTKVELPMNYQFDSQDQAIFALSKIPLYSVEIQRQIHSDVSTKQNVVPIETKIINTPIPQDYCHASISFLKQLIEYPRDDILDKDVIVLYLQRKWSMYAYKFYLFQFFAFLILLASMTQLLMVKQESLQLSCLIIGMIANTWFAFYELSQVLIQRSSYFRSLWNITDFLRIGLIYYCIVNYHLNQTVEPDLQAILFLLLWIKIFFSISVFQPIRYMIKMVFEIVAGIKSFLIILTIAILCYAQLTTILYENAESFAYNMKYSYVLSFGELGSFEELDYFQFVVFIFFSFVIPLVLMNMLIAIMGDIYGRVQENSIAADSRQLANMILELEELGYYYKSKFNPDSVKDEYYYCFYTRPIGQ